jgi:hypothetical protein
MNYSKNYYDYIEYVKSQHRTIHDAVKYEAHHIEPKCIRPDLENFSAHPENCVLLTYREHFLAHYLLCKIYCNTKHEYQLLYAVGRMLKRQEKLKKYIYVNSRLYEKLKIKQSSIKKVLCVHKETLKQIRFDTRFLDQLPQEFILYSEWKILHPGESLIKNNKGKICFTNGKNRIYLLENETPPLGYETVPEFRKHSSYAGNAGKAMFINIKTLKIKYFDKNYQSADWQLYSMWYKSQPKHEPIPSGKKCFVNVTTGKQCYAYTAPFNHILRTEWTKTNHIKMPQNSHSPANKNQICIVNFNTKQQKYIDKNEEIPEGYVKGSLNKGKKYMYDYPDSLREFHSKKSSKSVKCLETNQIWPSAIECAKSLNIKDYELREHCRNKKPFNSNNYRYIKDL